MSKIIPSTLLVLLVLSCNPSQCETPRLVDRATAINASPLTLINTTDESFAKLTKEEQAREKEILTALWESAIEKSEDIQYVMEKLIPNGDGKKSAKILMKTLSTIIYTGIGTMGMLEPSQSTYIQSTMAMVDPMLETNYPSASSIPSYERPKYAANYLMFENRQHNKREQLAKVSQAEQIMLYSMIRNTANQIVCAYRNYLSATDEPSKALARQKLIDLSGAEAVDKLDKASQLDQR